MSDVAANVHLVLYVYPDKTLGYLVYLGGWRRADYHVVGYVDLDLDDLPVSTALPDWVTLKDMGVVGCKEDIAAVQGLVWDAMSDEHVGE